MPGRALYGGRKINGIWKRKNDVFWYKEGELVRFSFECDGERTDGRCGCRRSMTGMSTLTGTTTVRVQHLPITSEQFVSLLKESYKESGFPMDDEVVQDEAGEPLRLAAAYPLDAVIEKRGDYLQQRA